MLVKELIDHLRLGLIDDHPPSSFTVSAEGREQLDVTSQFARTATKSTSSQADIAKVKIEGGSNGLIIVGIRRDGERLKVGRQELDLRQVRGGRGRIGPADSYGIISWGGLRFWPAETRSGLGSGYSVAVVGMRCGVGFCVFWASVA